MREGVSRRYTLMCLLGFAQAREIRNDASPIPIAAGARDLCFPISSGSITSATSGWFFGRARFWRRIARRVARATGSEIGAYAVRRFTEESSPCISDGSHRLVLRKARGSRSSLHDYDDVAREDVPPPVGEPGPARHLWLSLHEHGIGGLNRGRIGCFADQVYPIYAIRPLRASLRR